MNDYNKEIEYWSKWFMECDKGKKTDEEIENEYIVAYWNFYDNIIQNELTWAKAVRTVHWIDEMM